MIFLHENILLDVDKSPVISDFGNSVKLDEGEESRKVEIENGPIKWMAPECLSKSIFSYKSDVYAYGITMFEILTKREPYPNLNSMQVMVGVTGGKLKPELSPALHRFEYISKIFQGCIIFEPEKRFSIGEINDLLDTKGTGKNRRKKTTTNFTKYIKSK